MIIMTPHRLVSDHWKSREIIMEAYDHTIETVQANTVYNNSKTSHPNYESPQN